VGDLVQTSIEASAAARSRSPPPPPPSQRPQRTVRSPDRAVRRLGDVGSSSGNLATPQQAQNINAALDAIRRARAAAQQASQICMRASRAFDDEVKAMDDCLSAVSMDLDVSAARF
jgi:hypothetical protein